MQPPYNKLIAKQSGSMAAILHFLANNLFG